MYIIEVKKIFTYSQNPTFLQGFFADVFQKNLTCLSKKLSSLVNTGNFDCYEKILLRYKFDCYLRFGI